MLSSISEWIIAVVESLGYFGIAGLIALENLFPPVPSEIVLPLAGFLVGRGRFFLPWVILSATGGSLASALTLYGIGAWLGERRVRLALKRFGRFLFLHEEDLDRACRWFDQHGRKTVLLGRLVPGVRSIISIPAGLTRMPIWQFVVYTTVGSGLWNTGLVGLGWVLGDQWELVRPYVQLLGYIVLGVLVAAALWFIWRRWRAHQN
jgi:membrane protein DedA with SNARE-associated domain